MPETSTKVKSKSNSKSGSVQNVVVEKSSPPKKVKMLEEEQVTVTTPTHETNTANSPATPDKSSTATDKSTPSRIEDDLLQAAILRLKEKQKTTAAPIRKCREKPSDCKVSDGQNSSSISYERLSAPTPTPSTKEHQDDAKKSGKEAREAKEVKEVKEGNKDSNRSRATTPKSESKEKLTAMLENVVKKLDASS